MNKISTPVYIKASYALAGLIILFGISSLVFVARVNPRRIFSDNYQPYALHISRGAGDKSAMKNAYQDGKMDSVIREFQKINSPAPEEYLLAGIAYLETNESQKAIETFKLLMDANALAKADFFEQDAEYYLAMSYLDNKESDKAMPIFKMIEADTDHPYNSNVSAWFLLNVRTAVAKQ